MITQDTQGSICDEEKKTINDLTPSIENDEFYKKFTEMYVELKKLGIIKKRGYDADPIDTIGRYAYEQMEEAIKNSPWLNPLTRFSAFPSS